MTADPAARIGADRVRVMRDAGLYMVPLAIGNVLPIVTLPVFTRILTTEEYGAWALANVFAVFVGGLASGGLSVGYERNFFQHADPRERAQLLYSVLSFVAATFAVAVLGTWIWGETLGQWMIGLPGQRALMFWSLCATAAWQCSG